MYYCSSYFEDYAFIKDTKKEEISFKSSRIIINIQWKFHWFNLEILKKNKMHFFYLYTFKIYIFGRIYFMKKIVILRYL